MSSPIIIPRTNYIPPTPAPRSVDNIQNDARDRFAGMIWVTKDESRTNEDYLVDFEHYEVYSEAKSYSKRPFQASYNGAIREYHNYLLVLEGSEGPQYYVVAKKIRSDLEGLEKYCECVTCTSSVINPMKYIWCSYCTKCIKAGPGFANPEFIEQAKLKKDLSEKKQKQGFSLYSFKNVPRVRFVEVAVIIIAFCIMYYMR